MSRRKSRTRRRPPEAPVVLFLSDRPAGERRSAWWSLVKAVLACGGIGGLVGGAIDAALRTDGSALTAALIGGIPAGVIGAGALGWYGGWFGAMNRLRHAALVGAALGLLGAGTLGMVAGLSIWALRWSLPAAIVGAALQWALTRRGRRPFGLFPGVMVGALIGILVRAVRAGPLDVMTDASDGALVGAVLGVLLIPALLAWLSGLPDLLRGRR